MKAKMLTWVVDERAEKKGTRLRRAINRIVESAVGGRISESRPRLHSVIGRV